MFSASAPVDPVRVAGVWVGEGQSLGTRRAPLAEPLHWVGGDHPKGVPATSPGKGVGVR